ncbi:hypothetical protein [Aquibium sp. ELW1220]|uniref:helix-turn-helix domain-containing protein n=1 Tax=Aquibium sp. ELW1220 TaxID=2976766 RepID=UPI0025B12D6B|nr:hypothetical protein [Aquibium sp. ELW1220]MDN2584385.1 hypothetical protein [Aquibium sp. ELW1220]
MDPYHYTETGLPNVWLFGIEMRDTAYGPVSTIPGIENLHRTIGMNIAQANRQMTGAEVRFLRSELDLSQRALAGLLDVQEKMLRLWEQGKVDIPGVVQRALAGFYLETVSDTISLRDLMIKLAETDRDLKKVDMRFKRIDEEWVPRTARVRAQPTETDRDQSSHKSRRRGRHNPR